MQTGRFRCEVCGAEFQTRPQPEEHWVQKHESPGHRVSCPSCGAQLATRAHLDKHTRVQHCL